MDLFDFSAKNNNDMMSPLSDRMRPTSLEEFIGQEHILAPNKLLSRAVRADKMTSCIFYGPPGCGKTTLAHIIASNTNGAFVKLNAVSSGVADAKKVIEDAKQLLKMYRKKTYVLLDECHRWSKAQSDCVLPALEDGSIILIGSTTENPFVSMTRAIVSRCHIFEFLPLKPIDIVKGLRRAIGDKVKGLGSLKIDATDDALLAIAELSSGDMRNAYNGLELASLSSAPDYNGVIHIDKATASESLQKRVISIDDSMYYDFLSAFCKSLRGSDPDAALYWAFRIIEAGCDPLLIFRRLMAHACEDVGMADSNALVVVVNACIAYEKMGIQEGKLPLSQAIVYVATAPKSNSVYMAMNSAREDAINHSDDDVPYYLRDRHFPSQLDDGSTYLYPHDYEGNYVEQQYLPDQLKDKVYYVPQKNDKNFTQKARKNS